MIAVPYRRPSSPIIGHVPNRTGDGSRYVVSGNDTRLANDAARRLRPFLRQHYNMFREWARQTVNEVATFNITLDDLITSHVYGEYRLMLEGDRLVPQFIYRGENGVVVEGGPGGYDYNPTQSDFFTNIIQTSAPGKIFFLPSIGTMFMSLSNNTTQWTQSFTQYFQGSGGGNNSRGGRIPALWRGLVTNTDGDYDARLRGTGADADPMTNAPWFDIENLSSNPGDPDTTFETVWNLANFPGVLDIPTRLDDAGNQIPFDVNVFFLRWVISLQDEIEDDNLLEIMARHAIQATFCTRNNGLTGPLRTAIGNGGDGAIPNEYTEPSDLNIRGACREFFRFFEDENFIPREAQISDDRYRFDPDSNFFQTAFLDIQDLTQTALGCLTPKEFGTWSPHWAATPITQSASEYMGAVLQPMNTGKFW